MDGVTIIIDWALFLGIIGALIGFAWYSSGRFTKLETDTEWIKDLLKALKVTMDNRDVGAFASNSPVSLTVIGTGLLNESGIKKYIDSGSAELFEKCEIKKQTNPYEVQKHIFELFDKIELPKETDDEVKKYAYDKGISSDIIRRVGAIYFRDICLGKFRMKTEDIDKHDPAKN